MMQVHGVDVSGWQKPLLVDWDAAYADGCAFAIVKRAQGRGPTRSGHVHARRIEASDVARGDYHFADTRHRRDRLDPTAQAETFCQAVGELWDDDLIPWLDLEWHSFKTEAAKQRYYRDFNRAAATEWALAWLDYVERRLGVRPGIYTLASYAKHRLTEDPELKRSPLWLAGAGGPKLDPSEVPTVDQVTLKAPAPWDEWTLYQWTSAGKVPWYRGGVGRIDRNLPHDGLATLAELRCGGRGMA